MNNLKYYNESLAYDFEMFMPRTAVKKKKDEKGDIVKLPKTASKQYAKRRAAASSLSVSVFAVMACVFLLAALCGNIFLRLRINEVNSEINDIKSQINVIDSEQTSLEVEFERRISYSNIELEATELGMQKMDKDQVKYIRVNDKNTAVTKDGKTVFGNE